ncbi:MAG: alpha/beta fold hydrolase, partial [Nanoarchaeota archaeon]|nr:alpha/beta fold hydrolase [Nanoarchaeota archaeon]
MKEKVFFKSSKGNSICGVLSNPSNKLLSPIIILCHGFRSSKDSNSYKLFEEKFNAMGVSTFRFDFFGHGESSGLFEDVTVSEAVDNTLKAIDFLKGLGYTKIGLIGSSFGGLTSIITATKCRDLFALGLRCPVSDMLGKLILESADETISSWKKKGVIEYKGDFGWKLNYSFYEDAKKYAGYKDFSQINIPTIIVHGEKDLSVPVEQSKKLSKIIPGSKLVLFPFSGHGFEHHNDYERAINLI